MCVVALCLMLEIQLCTYFSFPNPKDVLSFCSATIIGQPCFGIQLSIMAKKYFTSGRDIYISNIQG